MICTAHQILCGCLNQEKFDGWACSMYEEMRDVYRVLVGKPEGKRTFGRPKHRWEDNINMDVQEMI